MVMTAAEFERMCAWLRGPEALNVRVDPDQRDDLDAAEWDCDGTHQGRCTGVDKPRAALDPHHVLVARGSPTSRDRCGHRWRQWDEWQGGAGAGRWAHTQLCHVARTGTAL